MKYKLTDNIIIVNGKTLHRIECVTPFGDVKIGDKGGYVESEKNLSQNGTAWIFGNAKVYGNATVYGNAMVYYNTKVGGNVKVSGEAWLWGDAKVCENSDYIVFKNNWSSGRFFTWTRSNDMWKVGCFYGTGEELINKAYKDSENCGKHYEAYVKFVEQLKTMEE